MDMLTHVERDMKIPKKRCKVVTASRIIALVPEDWALGESPKTNGPVLPDDMDERMCSLCLSPSYTHIPEPFIKVFIKLIRKRPGLASSLPSSHKPVITESMGYAELLAALSTLQAEHQWSAAYQDYNHGRQPTLPSEQVRKHYNDVLRGALTRLYGPSCVLQLCRGQFHQDALCLPQSLNHNVEPALAVLESDQAFYILQPFEEHTVHDLIHFSPCAVFENSTSKSLFLVYQVIKLMVDLHERGMSVGSLNLHNLIVDQNLWISVSLPCVHSIQSMCLGADLSIISNDDKMVLEQCKDISPRDLAPVSSLSDLVNLWVERDISNYQYLMCLNFLAGRRLDSPNHHPILPWLMDFSGPNLGFRDLTRSKYRLNKGDDQLDLTYETDPCIGSLYPHHISDFLSDITYYIYEARRTPKQVLCTHVRRKWEPHEYPTSMRRIYEWSPDECIPAFFTDPGIFKSIHEDLPNLEPPEWCRTPEEFISRHMMMLESDRISSQLHDWIDLTFGYKLTGKAAVAAKNVCLELVNHHTRLTNHGVIQLFQSAHPSRAPKRDPFWTDRLPRFDPQKKSGQDMCGKSEKEMESLHAALQVFGEAIVVDTSHAQVEKLRTNLAGVRYTDERIGLPDEYEPLRALERMEKVYEFAAKNVHKLPNDENLKLPRSRSVHERLVNKDLNELGCFVMEVLLASKIRLIDPDASLHERYDTVRNTVLSEWRDLPRTVRKAAHMLLKLDSRWNSELKRLEDLVIVPNRDELFVHEDPCLSAGYLLHSATSPIPFPPYFRQLYSLISGLKSLDSRILVALKGSGSGSIMPVPRVSCGEDIVTDLYREKVLNVNEILIPILPDLDPEGVDLILPYLVDLFENENTTVSAAWLLFNHIGRALGPKETAKHFLKPLVRLYNGENASKKHLKLYERSFLRQLMIRFGLQIFLGHFSTLLVEAAAAYRDFPTDEDVFQTQENPLLMTNNKNAKLSTATIDADYQMKLIEEREHKRSRTETKLEIVMEMDSLEKPTLATSTVDSENELDSMTDSILIHDYDEDSNALTFPNNDESEDEDVMMNHKSEDSSSKSKEDDASSCSGSSDQLGQSLRSVHSVPKILESEERPQSASASSIDGETVEEVVDMDFQNETEEDIGPVNMVRSETEEFTQALLDGYQDECNVCDVSTESIKWLSRKIGPLMTAKFFSRNLLRMLNLCYVGEEQMSVNANAVKENGLPASNYSLIGDRNSERIIQCLAYIATFYGEQVILLQYIPYIKDTIAAAQQKFKNRSEAGLVGCLALFQHIIAYMSDAQFMDRLQGEIFDEILLPIVRLASSKRVSFSGGGRTRQAIFHKIIDILYIIGIRIGFEFIRQMMTPVLQRLFASFDRVYGRQKKTSSELQDANQPEKKPEPDSDTIEDNVFCEIKRDRATNEYKISTPVKVEELGTASSWQYSLSPPFNEERDPDESDASTTSTQESIMTELREAFTPELAHTAYVPFCRLAGGIYIEEKLINHDLIRQLCSQHDEALSERQVSPDKETFSDDESDACDGMTPSKRRQSKTFVKEERKPEEEPEDLEVSGQFGRNVTMSGNRIIVDKSPERPAATRPSLEQKRATSQQSFNMSLVKNDELDKNPERHLKGNWLAYWEHELGLNEKSAPFNFKQIKLQTFTGHTNAVKAITVMDSENAFMTSSKDKTVKLWSIQNVGDERTKQACKWTYTGHKKSVFAVSFLESARVAISCDSSVHIWDPFVGMRIHQIEVGPRTPAVSVLAPLPAPSTQVITATTDGTLRFLDARIANYAHEFKCTYGSAGYIRSVSVSPNTNWVAVGYSSGVISILDVRTGFFLKAWKGHEAEILQIRAFDNNRFLTLSLDQTIALWNKEDGKVLNHLKGHTEAAVCFNTYKNEVVSATAGNRVGVHTSIESQPCDFSCVRLRSDTFKGVLTTMALLPLNRQLLLGADNGAVRLLC